MLHVFLRFFKTQRAAHRVVSNNVDVELKNYVAVEVRDITTCYIFIVEV